MIDQFSEYLDGIKAGSELKEKTKKFVIDALSNPMQRAEKQPSRGNIKKRRLAAAFVAFGACMTVAISGYAYYNYPTDYISLDINPSVELGINAFDRVISVEGVNQDGTALVLDYEFKNLSVEDAVCTLVQQAAEQNYIAENGSTVIAVTAQSQKTERAEMLQNQGENGVNLALREENKSAVLYKDCSDLSLRSEAKELGVSPGKLKIIKTVQQMDPTITAEQLKDATITDILIKADELIRANSGEQTQTAGMAAFMQKIQTAVSLMQANMGLEQMNQNQVQTQSQNQNSQQSQNQSQAQSTEEAQSGQNAGQQQQNAGGETAAGQGQNGDMTQTQDQTQDQTHDQTQDQTQDRTQAQDGTGSQTCDPQPSASGTQAQNGSQSGTESQAGTGSQQQGQNTGGDTGKK